MSLPTEFDFAVIKIGDGATTEVFTAICGMENVNISRAANSQDRFVRDCAKPGEVPTRKVKITGKQMDITGDGLIDKAQITVIEAALGIAKNYEIECYSDDGTDTGNLEGTYSGSYVMTTGNTNVPRDATGANEISLANHGTWTWTAA